MHTDSVGKVFIADLPANSFFLGGRITKEAEIWQQEHHKVIWQTAVQTKVWRVRVKGREGNVLKYSGKFKGVKAKPKPKQQTKKKARNIFLSEELSMVYFKTKKLCSGLYDVYSFQAKEKCLTGHMWKPPALWALFESTGNKDPRSYTCGSWSVLMCSSGAIPVARRATLYRWLSLKFGSLFFWYGTKIGGFNALKSLYPQAWACNVCYSWQGLSFGTEVMTGYFNKEQKEQMAQLHLF